MYALDDDSVGTASTADLTQYSTLDECLDDQRSKSKELFSLGSLIRGQPPMKKQKTQDLKPIAFVRFNT